MSGIKPIQARPYHDIDTPFSIDEKGAFAEYIVSDPNLMPELAIGANILILDTRSNKQQFWIAGRIIGLRAISPFKPERENMLFQPDEDYDAEQLLDELEAGPHQHQPMTIRVEIDREIDSDTKHTGSFLSAPVQRPPSSKSRMFFPSIKSKSDDAVPSLEKILDIKGQGAVLGVVGSGNTPFEVDNEFLEYKLDLKNLDNKHIFIVGESGAGKTVFLKNLAYQIRKLKNRVILTDVQGDVIQLMLKDYVQSISLRKTWQQRITMPTSDDIFNEMGPFQVVLPLNKEGKLGENALALQKVCEANNIEVCPIGLRLQDVGNIADVEYLMRISSPQVPMLLDDITEAIKAKPEKVTIDRIERFINSKLKENSEKDKPASTIRSSKGVSYYLSTFEAALRALRSLKDFFDHDTTALKNDEHPMACFMLQGTTILYLDDLSHDAKIMWEMQLLRWLNDNKKELSDTFVFFDEAHQIIPAHPIGVSAKETFDRLRANFETLARDGRKYRVNLVLSTQSPKDLHEIVPDQCPNRVVMKINPRNAAYAYLDPELAMIANKFSAGEFWFQSPFNGTPNWLRVHGIANPIPHEPMDKFWDKIRKAADELPAKGTK